ncbi:hypothetical protein METHPM2_1290003 [Pseudomonas sp. PM2]
MFHLWDGAVRFSYYLTPNAMTKVVPLFFWVGLLTHVQVAAQACLYRKRRHGRTQFRRTTPGRYRQARGNANDCIR